jgi:hypothetical protein
MKKAKTKLPAILFCALLLLQTSCGKDGLVINLKRDGKNDARQDVKTILFDYNDCSSLSGFGGTPGWQIDIGYQGDGFYLNNVAEAYLEFNRTTDVDVVLTFWTRTANGGTKNFIPEVTIDGQVINTAIVSGSEFAGEWMKMQTSTIPKGTRNIKISFLNNLFTYSYYLDEICLMR